MHQRAREATQGNVDPRFSNTIWLHNLQDVLYPSGGVFGQSARYTRVPERAGARPFALIGAGGPMSLRLICEAIAIVDPKDSVRVIDSHFPEAAFFTEFERVDRGWMHES